MHHSDSIPPDVRLKQLEEFFEACLKADVLTTLKEIGLSRDIIAEHFKTLLFHERPWLMENKGLAWPYAQLARSKPRFECALDGTGQVRREALAWLARLPFSGQWAYMDQLARAYPKDPEVKSVLDNERQLIAGKVAAKSSKRLRLRNSLQVLKMPVGKREKGLIRIFSLPYIFAGQSFLEEMSRDYVVFVEPAAGVNFRHTWMRRFMDLEDKPVFGAAGDEDLAFFRAQEALGIKMAHSDFLPEFEEVPLNENKEFDLVFNGLYDEMPRKRHGLLLEMLSEPPLTGKTALVIGRGSDQAVDEFKAMVRDKGLRDRVETMVNIPRLEVPRQLARCRLGVHLAIMENGCRAIYEYLRSDLPCIVSACMAGTNFEHFNQRTGAVVRDQDLGPAIARALDDIQSFEPRKWYLENSGSANSTRKFNRLFSRIFAEMGYEWTVDAVAMTSSGAHRYARREDYEKFKPELARLTRLINETTRLPVSFKE